MTPYYNKETPPKGREGQSTMSIDHDGGKSKTRQERQDVFVEALVAFDSNIGSCLGHTTGYTRFFKVMRRNDGSWLAMMGALDEDAQPCIAFGNGKSLLDAWSNLGRSLAAGEWREDKYAPRE